MIKVIYGAKGTGKTKMMIDAANATVEVAKGHMIYITDSKRGMYDLEREIRFIDTSEYDIAGEAALCGFIIGLPALRLRGDYLAIVTLAFGEIVRVIFTNAESFGGAQGMATPRFDKKYLFIVGLVLVLATLAIIQNLLKSKHGRAITAIRDNEIC